MFLNCWHTYATKAVLLQYPFYRYFHGSSVTDITTQVSEHIGVTVWYLPPTVCCLA